MNKLMKLILLVFGVFALVLVIKIPVLSSQNNDWIGFWGSLFGSTISGIVTFIALKITIEHENQKMQKDKQIEEERRIDDKRMSIYPYFVYSVNDKNSKRFKRLSSVSVTPKKYMDDLQPGDAVIPDFSFNLFITNLGLGSAIMPRLSIIQFDNKTSGHSQRYNYSILNIKQTTYINIEVKWPNVDINIRPEDLPPDFGILKLKIFYDNILQDRYEQEIEILLNQALAQTIENGEVVDQYAYFEEPIIRNITKPKIVNLKDK